jgi:hypothetical protein
MIQIYRLVASFLVAFEHERADNVILAGAMQRVVCIPAVERQSNSSVVSIARSLLPGQSLKPEAALTKEEEEENE